MDNHNCLDEVLTTTEAGERWGLPGDTVKRAALEGRLRAKKSGWVWLTTRSAMKETFGMKSSEVKISKIDGKPHCPMCGKAGEYKAGGQTCSDEWVWENGKLIAVPRLIKEN